MATVDGTKTRRKDAGSRPVHLFDRQPPCNLDAERNTLGSMLIMPEVCDEVSLIVKADDFYDAAHQTLFRHCVDIYNESQRIDVTLLVDRLKISGDYDQIDGASLLAEVSESVPTAANAEYYAKIVRDKAIMRSIIQAGTEIVRDAYEETDAARLMLSQAEERIFRIGDEDSTATDVTSAHDALMEAFEQIDARVAGGASGLPTGFTDLDKKTGGLHKAELVIIAARPSMGKTALAANIAEHVAITEQQTTLFVSLEMSRLELVQRMMCSQGSVNGENIRSGYLSGDDNQRLVEVSGTLGNSPMFIDDTPTRTITEIAATARRLKRRQGQLGLIVIDYLQLIQPDNLKDPRQEQVAKMARRLKVLARELSVPIICLAQLNRQAEMTKGDHRPKLSHLRESGAIEQDADVVLLVHREEYYLSEAEKEAMRSGANPNSCLGEADLIIAKQRNGPTGELKLHWFQQYTQFKNAPRHQYDELESFNTGSEF